MVISDVNTEPDKYGQIVLSQFKLNDIQKNALTILYHPPDDPKDLTKMLSTLKFKDELAGRDMSPIKIVTNEVKKTDNGLEKLPRIFEKLYVSSIDNDTNNRGRKLMSIDKKPYPGLCVKYQGHELNPPAYIVYIPDIEKDKIFFESQKNELISIKQNLSFDNLEYINTRIKELERVLKSWSNISISRRI